MRNRTGKTKTQKYSPEKEKNNHMHTHKHKLSSCLSHLWHQPLLFHLPRKKNCSYHKTASVTSRSKLTHNKLYVMLSERLNKNYCLWSFQINDDDSVSVIPHVLNRTSLSLTCKSCLLFVYWSVGGGLSRWMLDSSVSVHLTPTHTHSLFRPAHFAET